MTDRPTRRELLQHGGMATLALPLLAAGCVDPPPETPTDPGAGQPTTAANPLGFDPAAGVEIVVFDGGVGQAYATDLHVPMLSARHPDLAVEVSATKEINKVVQPRINGGNPPDVVQNSGAGSMDLGALADSTAMADLAPLLDAPSWDDPGVKVRDLLLPEAIEKGVYNGKDQVLWYSFTIFGLYFDQSLFTRKGWQLPANWDEFMALCERIKADGMAPFTYPGKYPSYMVSPIMSAAAKAGGKELLLRLDNLEEGAWLDPAVIDAAIHWQEVGQKYLLQGTAGLDHIQSQSAQNRGEVAFVPCGSWIENEQKEHITGDFTYGVMPVPGPVEGAKLPPEAMRVDPTMAFLVCADGRNPRAGMEYLRAMISHEGASKFSELVATITTVKGGTEGAKLKPGITAAAKAAEAAGDNRIVFRWAEWYGELRDESAAATGRLMAGDLAPRVWAERLQRMADQVRDDPEITKQTRK